MSCLQRGDRPGFEQALRDSRLQTMSQMQGLSCRNEAYGRAYPSLLQLHMLREAEEGFLLLHPASAPTSASTSAIGGGAREVDGVLLPSGEQDRRGADGSGSWSWEHRLELLSPSLRHRDEAMSLQRGIFELCRLDAQVAGNWLALSDLRRKRSDLHGARAALRHAEVSGLSAEEVLIRECSLVQQGGDLSGAIALLEPLELDVTASRMKFRRAEVQAKGAKKSAEALLERRQLAQRLFLTAQWLSRSHVKHGKAVIDRYKLALDLRKDWEAAHFELAKYYEVVAEKRKDELGRGGTVTAVKKWQALAADDIFLTNSVVSE
jgi:hypothetical protein